MRCGSCRHVFNAIGCLDYVEPSASGAEHPAAQVASGAQTDASSDARRSAPAPSASAAQAPTSKPPSPPHMASALGGKASKKAKAPAAPPSPVAAVPPTPPVIHGLAALSAAPVSAETPRGLPAGLPSDGSATQPLAAAANEAQPPEAAMPVDDPGIPELEPEFLRGGSAQISPGVRIALGTACLILAPALVVQLALVFRSSLLVHLPELQPALAALCAPLGCSAQWPMRPELLAVVSSELQAVPGTEAMELNAVVRNRADFPMALPALELTLTDSLNRPVARKVFTPADYQAFATAAAPSDNLAAGADLSIRLVFELRGISVAGFVAYPFYP